MLYLSIEISDRTAREVKISKLLSTLQVIDIIPTKFSFLSLYSIQVEYLNS